MNQTKKTDETPKTTTLSLSNLSKYDQVRVLQYWPQYYDPDVYQRFAHVRAQLEYYASEFHYQNKVYRTGPYFCRRCTFFRFALIKVHNKKTFDDYENTFQKERRGVQFTATEKMSMMTAWFNNN